MNTYYKLNIAQGTRDSKMQSRILPLRRNREIQKIRQSTNNVIVESVWCHRGQEERLLSQEWRLGKGSQKT